MPSILPISIHDLLYRRGIESARVEFKAGWDELIGEAVLRSICAFANDFLNLNGGYILLGVEEGEKSVARLPPKGLDAATLEKAEKRLREWCQGRLEPLYMPVFSRELVDDRWILAIWAPGGQIRPYKAPESSKKGAERRYYVRIGAETVDASRDPRLLHQLLQLTARVPFDDRRAMGASLLDLRETKVREFLHDIESGLVDEPDPRTLYRRLKISEAVNGHDAPLNAGLLFFSADPRQFFPGAAIEVVQFADDASGNVLSERIFDQKPIHEQIRDCLSFLDNLSVRQITKLPGGAEAAHWVSYPHRAMQEAVVNAMYHRSYERDCPDPTKVYLYPDRMEITSYPGPVPGIEARHFEPGQSIPSVPARNRRIGDFLKTLKLAETRGTGIPKMLNAMRQNGSPVPRFDFDEGRTYFRVTLPAHPEYQAILALQDIAHLRAIGELREAYERLREAFERHPGNLGLALEMTKADISRDDLPAAVEVYERFRAANPVQRPAALVNLLAGAYLDRGEASEAKSWMDRLGTLDSVEDAFDAAIHEHRAGRFTRAHEYFHATGDAVLRDPKALHEFAQVKIQLAKKMAAGKNETSAAPSGRRLLQEARDMLERVVQMEAPRMRHAWAYFNLGEVLRLLAAPLDEVRRAFEKAQELLPGEARFQEALEELAAG